MSRLDATIIALCVQHNLLDATVTCHHSGDKAWFNSNVQWADESKPHGRGVAMATGVTFAEALNSAVTAMLTTRVPEIPADLELAA